LKMFAGNGWSPYLYADGSPMGTINVSGTATFDAGTFIRPVSELGTKAGMKTGKHLILTAGEIDDPGNIDIVPEAKTGHWQFTKKLDVTPKEFWLSFRYPATIVMVR